MRGSELLALGCTACALSHEPISVPPDGGVDSGIDSGIHSPSSEPYAFDCAQACAAEPPICVDGGGGFRLSCTERCERFRGTNPAFCEREPVELLECFRLHPGACEDTYSGETCKEQWEAFFPCDVALYDFAFDCAAACAADPPICEPLPDQTRNTCEMLCGRFFGEAPTVCDREPLDLVECWQENAGACQDPEGHHGCAEEWEALYHCGYG